MRWWLVLITLIASTVTPRAEEIIAGLSTDRFEITSNFVGGSLVVFGTINRDAQTIARAGKYDVAIVVTGPRSDITTRRKARVLGIWVNREAARFEDAPLYYATLASNPLEEIAPAASKERFGIGTASMPLEVRGFEPNETSFREALIRLKASDALYFDDVSAVSFLSDTLFTANIALPAIVPIGDFTVDIYAFRDGALIGQTSEAFRVQKTGFEQFMFNLAHNQPLLYGIVAVLLAIFTGWAAGVIFRRD